MKSQNHLSCRLSHNLDLPGSFFMIWTHGLLLFWSLILLELLWWIEEMSSLTPVIPAWSLCRKSKSRCWSGNSSLTPKLTRQCYVVMVVVVVGVVVVCVCMCVINVWDWDNKRKHVLFLWQYTWDNQLKRKRRDLILGHGFRGFNLGSPGLVILGLWQGETSWWEHIVEPNCL
jgi:hypothetical protein